MKRSRSRKEKRVGPDRVPTSQTSWNAIEANEKYKNKKRAESVPSVRRGRTRGRSHREGVTLAFGIAAARRRSLAHLSGKERRVLCAYCAPIVTTISGSSIRVALLCPLSLGRIQGPFAICTCAHIRAARTRRPAGCCRAGHSGGGALI